MRLENKFYLEITGEEVKTNVNHVRGLSKGKTLVIPLHVPRLWDRMPRKRHVAITMHRIPQASSKL